MAVNHVVQFMYSSTRYVQSVSGHLHATMQRLSVINKQKWPFEALRRIPGFGCFIDDILYVRHSIE